ARLQSLPGLQRPAGSRQRSPSLRLQQPESRALGHPQADPADGLLRQAMSDELHDSAPQASTLVAVLRRRALAGPDRRAYTFLLDGESREVHLTYGELDRQARTIAARLQDLDAAGERVLLLYPPGLQYAAAFFGCLYAGAAAVPVYPPRPNRPDPRVRSILTDARPRVVLTTSAILPNAERLLGGEAGVHWLATDGLDLDEAAAWLQPVLDPGDLAFLQYTSGSTSAPK